MRCVSTMRLAIPMFYQVFLRSLETIIGTHENAVRCIEFSSETNAIITGSWDSTIKLWDPRAVRCMGTYAQPDKVIVDNCRFGEMCTSSNYFILLFSIGLISGFHDEFMWWKISCWYCRTSSLHLGFEEYGLRSKTRIQLEISNTLYSLFS